MSAFRDGVHEAAEHLKTSARNAPIATKRFLKNPRAVVNGAPLAPLMVLMGHTFIDQLDNAGFNVILPEIQDDFDLSLEAVANISFVSLLFGLGLGVPVAVWSEKSTRRTMFLGAGAVLAAIFSLVGGLSTTLFLLVLARGGFGLGLRLNDPVQSSLAADYYAIETRPSVFSARDGMGRAGQLVGPLFFGGVTALFGWRAAVLGVAVPAAVLAFFSFRLWEPKRGAPERAALGLDPDAEDDAEPPTLEEAFAVLRRIGTVRRLWYALPFLTGGTLVLGIILPLYADDIFGMDAAARGLSAAFSQAAAILGLVVATPIMTRYLTSDRPERVFNVLSVQAAVVAAGFIALALAPNTPAYVLIGAALSAVGAIVAPAIAVLLSLVVPPRVRTISFAAGSLWVLPGLFFIPIIASVGDTHGLRWGVLLAMPMFLIGSLIIGTGGKQFTSDMAQAMQASAAAIEEQQARAEGRTKLLVCRGVDVHYGQVQVLFDVDFDVEEGEMVALLGTNGAGKSTLLRAISGTTIPSGGTVLFDGEDITSASPQKTASMGIVQVPGGKGVFPTMTVEENLRVATWLYRDDPDYLESAIEEVLDSFPILRQRLDRPAGDLSGGEQQMLVLSQAFIAKPKLLAIDELSLGLAPTIVQLLLDMVRKIHDAGVTVVLVEQSVNVALTVCDRAVFLEKGEVRFEGPTKELLDRPDVLRSVFLEGATSAAGSNGAVAGNGNGAAVRSSATGSTNGSAAGTTSANGHAPVSLTDLREQGVTIPQVLGVRSLSKNFGGIRAVNDVSFELHAGEVLGLIGTNGAGKTTIFDLISGFQTPTSGRILLDDVDITDMPAFGRSRLRLGRSFQDARLFPNLTVTETIAVSLERHLQMTNPLAAAIAAPAQRLEERAIRDRVDELIETLGLGAFADKFIGELSTGSRRIVDLAAALAHEPKILLLDEPSSGIAQKETEALGPLITRIKNEMRCALLIIEHDMPLISSVSDRLVALEAGTVIAEGRPSDVLADDRVIASYLGTDERIISRSGEGAAVPTRPAATSPAATRRARRRRAPLVAAPSATAVLPSSTQPGQELP